MQCQEKLWQLEKLKLRPT